MKGYCDNCEQVVNLNIEVSQTIKAQSLTIEVEVVCDECNYELEYRELEVALESVLK